MGRKNSVITLIIVLYLIISICSCIDRNQFAENRTITNEKWGSGQIIRFEYENNDTLQVKNVFINLRHSNQYPYSNIYFFVTTLAPNGMSIRDTVEYMLADNNGKWLGSGIGNLHSIQLAYKRNVRFGQQGKYIFYIQHGMRETILEGVTDIGLLIENAKP